MNQNNCIHIFVVTHCHNLRLVRFSIPTLLLSRLIFHQMPEVCYTSLVPVEGKSSVCLICMKYMIIILINIIIISLGEILLSYIAQHITHARTHTCIHAHVRTHVHICMHVHTHTHTPPSPFRFDVSVAPKRDEVNAPFSLAFMAGSWVMKINTRAGDPIFQRFWMFFAYQKLLGRTETQTHDRVYCQTI